MHTFRGWRPLVLAVLAMASVVVFPSVALAATGPERIQAAWVRSGGATGPVGAPTADAVCDGPDSGCRQTFEHATFYNSFHTNSFYVMADAIGAAYDASGGPSGRLGYPVGLAGCPTGEVGCQQWFSGGQLLYSAATGAHAVLHATDTDQTGLEGFFEQAWTTTIGYPTGDLSCTLTGGGCMQQFQHGASYQPPPTRGIYGHLMLDGPIRDYWLRSGAQDGPLGYPWSNTTCDPAGQCFERFEQGVIVAYSVATGVHMMPGSIAGLWWQDSQAETSLIPSHGMPTADAVCTGSLCTQDFQHSTIWTPFPGRAIAIVGAIRDKWVAAGRSSVKGYPNEPEACGLAGGGCSQNFQGGTAYWSPTSGAHFLSLVIEPSWTALKGVTGTLGYPTGDEVCGLLNGGCRQAFQGGAEYWSGQSGGHFVRGPIASAWTAQKAERGPLGYPITDPVCGLVRGGCVQAFQGGNLYWSPTTAAHAVRGAIRTEYAALRWENNLGYPTADQFCGLVGGGCGQHFENGSIYWSPASGSHVVRGAIYKVWALNGWEHGRYGYPIGEPTAVAGGRFTQAFQHGRLTA